MIDASRSPMSQARTVSQSVTMAPIREMAAAAGNCWLLGSARQASPAQGEQQR